MEGREREGSLPKRGEEGSRGAAERGESPGLRLLSAPDIRLVTCCGLKFFKCSGLTQVET